MLKIYSLSFNQVGIDYEKLLNFLKFNPNIIGYWNYIPGVIFFKSFVLFSDIRPQLETHFAGRLFIIAEIAKFEQTWLVDGRAPKQAWEWFYDTPSNRLIEAMTGKP